MSTISELPGSKVADKKLLAKSPARDSDSVDGGSICWARSGPPPSRPVEHDLAALSREHRRECRLEIAERVVMRDDRLQVEPALQHRDHLVPGLEHLAAIDALDLETLEDHLIPVDRHVGRRNAEERHLAAVIHVLEQLPEGRGYA